MGHRLQHDRHPIGAQVRSWTLAALLAAALGTSTTATAQEESTCPDFAVAVQQARSSYVALGEVEEIRTLLATADTALSCGPPPKPADLAAWFLLDGTLHLDADPPRRTDGIAAYQTAHDIDSGVWDNAYAQHLQVYENVSRALVRKVTIELVLPSGTTAYVDGQASTGKIQIVSEGLHIVQAVDKEGLASNHLRVYASAGTTVRANLRTGTITTEGRTDTSPASAMPSKRLAPEALFAAAYAAHNGDQYEASTGATVRLAPALSIQTSKTFAFLVQSHLEYTHAGELDQNDNPAIGPVVDPIPGRQLLFGLGAGISLPTGPARTSATLGYEVLSLNTQLGCGGCAVPAPVSVISAGPTVAASSTLPMWGSGPMQFGPTLSGSASFYGAGFSPSSRRFAGGLGIAMVRATTK